MLQILKLTRVYLFTDKERIIKDYKLCDCTYAFSLKQQIFLEWSIHRLIYSRYMHEKIHRRIYWFVVVHVKLIVLLFIILHLRNFNPYFQCLYQKESSNSVLFSLYTKTFNVNKSLFVNYMYNCVCNAHIIYNQIMFYLVIFLKNIVLQSLKNIGLT